MGSTKKQGNKETTRKQQGNNEETKKQGNKGKKH
jgi:hypothetical protein